MGYEIATDANGNPYSVPMYFGTFNEQNNPLAMLALNPTRNWSHKFVPKFSFDLQLWDNLKYHFSYSADLSFGAMIVLPLPNTISLIIISQTILLLLRNLGKVSYGRLRIH